MHDDLLFKATWYLIKDLHLSISLPWIFVQSIYQWCNISSPTQVSPAFQRPSLQDCTATSGARSSKVSRPSLLHPSRGVVCV